MNMIRIEDFVVQTNLWIQPTWMMMSRGSMAVLVSKEWDLAQEHLDIAKKLRDNSTRKQGLDPQTRWITTKTAHLSQQWYWL